MSGTLTDKQRHVLNYIIGTIDRIGTAPTIREIGSKFKMKSTGSVRTVLSALSKKGYIKRKPLLSRGIELLRQTKPPFTAIPLLGRIAAGIPVLAVENIESNIAMDTSFVPGGDSFFLKVVGDSMKDAGILDGDYALIKHQPTANKGDIIVAMLGDETTVKRYFPEKDKIRLEPANPEFKTITIKKNTPNFRIIGKVTVLLRKM